MHFLIFSEQIAASSMAVVFNNTSLSRCLADGSLNMPPSKSLPGRNNVVPYVVLADDAITLKLYISRSLDVLRVWASAWRIIAFHASDVPLKTLLAICHDVCKTTDIAKAICALHNCHMIRGEHTYALLLVDLCNRETCEIVDGAWRKENQTFGNGLRRRIPDRVQVEPS